MELQDFLSKLSLPQDFTRRGFLKATSVMAAIGMMNQARAASGVRPYIVLETAKGILICDPNLCVACHRCELACTEFNEGKADPRLARIKITRNVMFGHAGTNVYPPTKGIWGDGIVVQDTCRQCAHPTPCANACPQGAIVVDPKTGARRVDKEKCIGCHLCEKNSGGKEAGHFTFQGFLAKVNYENPPTDEQIVAKCPAKCMSVDPHFETGR